MSRKNFGRGNRKRTLKKHGNQRKDHPVMEGVVQMTRDGYVFVELPDDPRKDVFVKASKTRGALDGDKVRVAVTRDAGEDRRREGEIVEIVERTKVPFVGILHVVGRQAWVLMQSKNMPYDISVDYVDGMKESKGMKVAALVDSWPRGEANPHGRIVDILGKPGENDTEMHAILAEYGLPYRFEPEVEEEAGRISDKITARDLRGRKDFRDTLTFTIDPADAKDYDDALSFRVLDGGNYEVGVHIADVSYYVTPGTLVDREAQERGTSVYLVDRTVPMLPEILSNNLCSLRPEEDKLTFSAVFRISPMGKVEDRWFGRTVIRSDHRFDYDTAQKIIEGQDIEGVPPILHDAIRRLTRLAMIFRRRRFASGAMNFERPEMKVEVDAKGTPVRVYEKKSREANWMIEEFMLLANRSVAEFIATGGKMNGKADRNAKTFVYRVHDVPDMAKLDGLRNFAGNFGYKMDNPGEGRSVSSALNSLLESAKGTPEFDALQLLALRSMAKASYSTDNIGHYGLAFKFYTHFTSPIRRYPDTMVHRLLSMYLDGAGSQDREYYENQCRHASEREVVATEAERASIKYKLVEFMLDKIGNEYDGHVSGLTEWGMYVEIDPTRIEGMVPLREAKSDFFEFDEEHYRLVGRRTGKVYRLGDPVRIKVKSANLEQKILDYELIEPEIETLDEGIPAKWAYRFPRKGSRRKK